MPKWIFLTQNYRALVDDEDFNEICKHHWHVCKAAYDIYAGRDYKVRGNRHRVYMHRAISNCPPGFQVHHRDSDTLNNARANLEICSQAQNLKHRKWRKKS
jgi:hypothetical protein